MMDVGVFEEAWFWAAVSAAILAMIFLFGNRSLVGILSWYQRRRVSIRGALTPLENEDDEDEPTAFQAYVNSKRLPQVDIVNHGVWAFDGEEMKEIDYEVEGSANEKGKLGKGLRFEFEFNRDALEDFDEDSVFITVWIATEDSYYQATYFLDWGRALIKRVGWLPVKARILDGDRSIRTVQINRRIQLWWLMRWYLWENNTRGV